MSYPSNKQETSSFGDPLGAHPPNDYTSRQHGEDLPPITIQPSPGHAPPGHPGYQSDYGPGYYPPKGYPQPGNASPIVQQPTMRTTAEAPGDGTRAPQGYPGVPPGLEYLSHVDQLLVHQKVELLEAFTGFETNNKYEIKNSMGQKVYYAIEDTDCCTRNCCGPLRPMDIKIFDNFRNEVIHMYRPLACNSCCCPCCLQSMEVSSPPGTVLGGIKQEWSILTPKFSVTNAAGDTVMKIKGPICTCSCCSDVEFKILSVDGVTEIGKITKQWTGLLREAFTDADHFGITFPMDLDVKMKAVMLGACFLIDVMYFERTN